MNCRRRHRSQDRRSQTITMRFEQSLLQSVEESLMSNPYYTSRTHFFEEALIEYLEREPCPRCHSMIPKTSNMCPYCGLELGIGFKVTALLRSLISDSAEEMVARPEIASWLNSCTQEEEDRVLICVLSELIQGIRTKGKRARWHDAEAET